MSDPQTKPDLTALASNLRRLMDEFLKAPTWEAWDPVRKNSEWYQGAWITEAAERMDK